MKNIIRIAVIMAIVSSALPMMAVTEKEMEEAKAITAMAYLRYANDGSGYLDDLPAPKTMADVKKSLKKQEVENLKSFTAVAVPKDYASWDKARLVEYWSSTFFKSAGLIEKGKLAKARVRSRIDKMTISSPAASASASAAPAPAPAPAEENKAVSSAASDVAAEGALAEETELLNDSLNAVANDLEASMSREMPENKSEGHTWVYVMILCILVAVVVGLVIFASNVMKRSSQESASRISGDSADRDRDAERREEEAREKFASALAAKNEEIRNLRLRVETLETENSALLKDAASYTRQISALKEELSSVRNAPKTEKSPAQRAVDEPAAKEQSIPQREVSVRSIYLGRVNSRGLFVRADRKLSIGHSLYRLDTTDGYSGTFRVAEDPTVWEMALLTPKDSLSGACTGKDLDATDGYTRIVTESPGTAVFEDGCWKVIRKAKIRYE